MVTESRSIDRVHVVWKATLTRLNGEQLPGSTDNVSEQGMNVILGKALVVGEPVRVEVVSKCTGMICYFTLEGEIIYSNFLESRLGSAIGLRLLKPSDQYIEFIRRYTGKQGSVLAS
ncbi:PilZ domain-containing protein [Motiliproteus sp. MSK22-1]|uniref:PilZ domain-containing protein n=1 Tax=Motiliproteus sp. MSK22-1 TaxID=1897630 RepID=UPI0009786116|nr:PilZ domain-containing protein [Motiliproteus sp. MSK22-1]OMH28366.1 hypothetical protein BGP75_20905 [Motiliproteus sp. MSK22-1]